MDIGETAADFTLPDETGTDRTLHDLLANGPVALFFYPMAMTGGCTAQACHFRDLADEFGRFGATPVGISADSVDKQAQFSAMHSFGYPLLSDPDGEVAAKFGVKRKLGALPNKRQTFVIGTDRTILGTVKSEVKMQIHADRALEILQERQQP